MLTRRLLLRLQTTRRKAVLLLSVQCRECSGCLRSFRPVLQAVNHLRSRQPQHLQDVLAAGPELVHVVAHVLKLCKVA